MGAFVTANHLLWVDLETTGVEGDAFILEVGAIYTDLQLNTLWEFSSLVTWADAQRVDAAMSPFVRNMHTENGLLADIEAAQRAGTTRRVEQVEAELVACIPEGDVVALAGSGVAHLDFPSIKYWMSKLTRRLEYYTIDTGILRRSLRIFGGEAYDIEPIPASFDTDVKAHRGLADIREHLAEARAYRDKLVQVVGK